MTMFDLDSIISAPSEHVCAYRWAGIHTITKNNEEYSHVSTLADFHEFATNFMKNYAVQTVKFHSSGNVVAFSYYRDDIVVSHAFEIGGHRA